MNFTAPHGSLNLEIRYALRVLTTLMMVQEHYFEHDILKTQLFTSVEMEGIFVIQSFWR